jgi:hypothetical protein
MENVRDLGKNGWQRIMGLTTYVDDSGSDPSSPVYVLGGVCLPSSWWEEHVSPEWSGVLKDTPPIPYFKASEVWEKDIEKESAWASLEPSRRRRKVDALVDVLTTYHPLTFSFQLNWSDFKDFKNTYSLPLGKDDPYFYLYYGAIILQARWGIREANPTPVDFVFDNQNQVGKLVSEWYPVFKSKCSSEIQRRLGNIPRFDDEKTCVPLQCADMFAWYARRNALDSLPSEWHKNVWAQLSRHYSVGTVDMEELIKIGEMAGFIGGDNSKEESRIGRMSKHPFVDAYYTYTMIVCVVVGALCIYAHLFWQGTAVIAGGALLFFLGRWMDAKLKGVKPTKTISLREAMKDEEE